jgi:drug/metabolite transporter, DME family
VVAAVGAAMLWGTTGTAQALGPEASDPGSVGALRIVVGAVSLVLVALPGLRRHRRHPGHRRAPAGRPDLPTSALLALGGLAVAAYQVCFFAGVARSGVAVGTVVALGVAPFATGLLGTVLGERVSRRWLGSTAGALVGVVLIVLGAGAQAGADGIEPLGVAAAVGAGVAYSGFTIAARALILRGLPGGLVMAAFFTLGALVLLPLLARTDLTWVATPSGMAMVVWLGVVATGVSYLLFQRGLSGLRAGTVATISLVEPVTAALLGVLVLDERLSPVTAVGITVVVASLLLVTTRPPQRRRPIGSVAVDLAD